MNKSIRQKLLAMYDYRDPATGRMIPGYDKEHAERTSRIVIKAARRLGITGETLEELEITTLLHDLGRVGLEPGLFSRIFGYAQAEGLPVRVTDLVSQYSNIKKEQAATFYERLVKPVLKKYGIALNDRVRRHIEMRMNFERLLRSEIKRREKEFEKLGVKISDWMVKVMLYYYYPEYLSKSSDQNRLMGMLLVACENLEAYNNIQRGRDYYGRRRESLKESFAVLKRFVSQKLITKEVYDCLKQLVSSGDLDTILAESRGYRSPGELPREYEEFKMKLRSA